MLSLSRSVGFYFDSISEADHSFFSYFQRGTAHTASGLGRRNRAQRLSEYAERRAAVLGQSCTPSIRLAGRKRRRWETWPPPHRRLPNATVLDVIHEMDEEEPEPPMKKPRVVEEQNLMDVRTMVFGMGASGDLRVGCVSPLDANFLLLTTLSSRYKYLPSLLKEILFPSPRSAEVDASPPKKRRRVEDSEDVDMADVDTPLPLASSVTRDKDTLRPVILETAKESYLLSPSIRSSPSSEHSSTEYDIGLVLEAEVIVEEEPAPTEAETIEEKVQDDLVISDPGIPTRTATSITPAESVNPVDVDVSQADSEDNTKEATPTPTEHHTADDVVGSQDDVSFTAPSNPSPQPPPKSGTSPVHSPEPLPGDDGTAPPSSPLPTDHSFAREKTPTLTDDDIVKSQFAVQILQRHLTQSMFRFADEGVYVRDGSGDGMEDEWVIQVKNWKWAPKGSKERLL